MIRGLFIDLHIKWATLRNLQMFYPYLLYMIINITSK